ncbi:hypothetical protein RRG08_000558 [Elysia crispata]|uniref:Uncharacterized protein n=1 Tax=Elysia crispata TaxID=231223 RepID=A0AAE1CUR8_9GAST|nr:hypothetical protein RRG08_000558 [Elysia crispata]
MATHVSISMETGRAELVRNRRNFTASGVANTSQCAMLQEHNQMWRSLSETLMLFESRSQTVAKLNIQHRNKDQNSSIKEIQSDCLN